MRDSDLKPVYLRLPVVDRMLEVYDTIRLKPYFE